jgi:hypothetical protein
MRGRWPRAAREPGEIERKYDDRYSQLLFVFGRHIKERRVRGEDLQELSDDKLSVIQPIASL